MAEKRIASDNGIRRLPRYLRILEQMDEQGVERISSAELGRMIGFSASQIRTDFNNFGSFGQQGYGYEVSSLCREIRQVLGMDRGFRAILVGVGNLGRALICNFDFCKLGLHLIAAVDVDPALLGKEIHGLPVLSVDAAVELIEKERIDLAILTVPKIVARQAADRLAAAGIRAIWNFTNTEVADSAGGLLVEDMNFDDSLLTLMHYMKNCKETETRPKEMEGAHQRKADADVGKKHEKERENFR